MTAKHDQLAELETADLLELLHAHQRQAWAANGTLSWHAAMRKEREAICAEINQRFPKRSS